MTIRLLIVGPQGSGKGTQAARIAGSVGIAHISTGDIFRANVSEGTPLGKQVQAVLAAGELVSDELTGALVRDRLAWADVANGFLLDGFPRNRVQAEQLDAFLSERAASLDAVLELAVPMAESVARLRQRALEQGREDDTEAVIENRLGIYHRETAPILDRYRARDLVIEIDGTGSPDEVTERILAALSARGIHAAAA